MRIRSGTNLSQPTLVLFSLILSIFYLNTISYHFYQSNVEIWYLVATMILSALIVSLIASGIGMLFDERSRFGGILLLVVFLPNIYYFMVKYPLLRFDGILAGMVLGVGLVLDSVMNNRFDKVSKMTRKLVWIYTSGVSFLIFYIFMQLIIQEDSLEVPTYLGTGHNEIFLFILSFFALIILLFILMKSIRGIKASDVFVYGPSRSGKTFLLLALYNQFVDNYAGKSKEVIISEMEEDYYLIANMLAELKAGRNPRSNTQTDLAIYILKGKIMIKPIEFSFVDYGGEHTESLKPAEYEKAIRELSSSLNGITPEILQKKIDDPIYINELKSKYASELISNIDKLVLAYIYTKFQNAGKVLFLVDGDHIVNYYNGGDQELTRLFGHYSRIMELFGDGKSYAIVVTKADQLGNTDCIDENSPEAANLEKEIFERLTEIKTFKEIKNRASKESIHFFIVSANAIMKNDDGREGQIQQIVPWRVEKIAKFGL